MGIQLSHSKVGKYQQCPKLYDYHYNQKLRSKVLNSPLFFGLACDEAINRLLLDKKKNHTESEEKLAQRDWQDVFNYHMKNATINGKRVDPTTYHLMQYSKSDFDADIIRPEYFQELGQDKEFCEAHIEWYHVEMKKKSPKISKEDRELFNLINWYSLYSKGMMIVEAYEKEVMPQIHEVFEIQKYISLPNENGDTIIGYIDFIASFVDDPDRKYIIDNKSSSSPYKAQDLDESDQLHTYSEAENIPDICYIVYEKNIRKKEPRVRITIWKGEASEDHIEKVFDNYEEVLHNIKEEKFDKNMKSGCFFFGRPCIYKSICHHGEMSDYLEDCKKEKK